MALGLGQTTITDLTINMLSGDGFTADYREAVGPLEGCGGTLTDSSGTFSSVDLDGNGMCRLHALGLLEDVVFMSLFVNHGPPLFKLQPPFRCRCLLAFLA